MQPALDFPWIGLTLRLAGISHEEDSMDERKAAVTALTAAKAAAA
ncbi:MAG: hypothetical protein ACREJG_06190 [Candidatus Rokuibacteriota bacterium]